MIKRCGEVQPFWKRGIKSYGTNARGFGTVDCNQCSTVCPMRFGEETNI